MMSSSLLLSHGAPTLLRTDALTEIPLQTVDCWAIDRRTRQERSRSTRRCLRDILVDGSKDDLVPRREVIKRPIPLGPSGFDDKCYGRGGVPAIPDMLSASVNQMLPGDFAHSLASKGARLDRSGSGRHF